MNTAPCISGMDACAGVSVTFYWPSTDLHITLKSGITPVRHNRDLFLLSRSPLSLTAQARPRYRKERAWMYAHFHHAHTPAHTCIQMAAMNLHCIYRCGKRPFYKWLLMMPLHCKESDYKGEIFRERESAGSFYSSLNLKTNPGGANITLIYQPVSGLCVYDVISACLNQIERNPKRTDQCRDRQ